MGSAYLYKDSGFPGYHYLTLQKPAMTNSMGDVEGAATPAKASGSQASKQKDEFTIKAPFPAPRPASPAARISHNISGISDITPPGGLRSLSPDGQHREQQNPGHAHCVPYHAVASTAICRNSTFRIKPTDTAPQGR